MMCPPGLALPPGLELSLPSLSPPPGLESCAEGAEPSDLSPMYVKSKLVIPASNAEDTVWIHNLPNNLCQKKVLEVTLQQAHLDKDVSSFTAKPGAPCGEAHIKLTSREAARRCASHFHGRRWGGFDVCAELIPAERVKTSGKSKKKGSSKTLSADAPEFSFTPAMSADAPVFVPSFGGFSADAPEFNFSFGLSAQAAEFTPMSFKTKVGADDEPLKVSSMIGSDVSTDDGASETEDIKAEVLQA